MKTYRININDSWYEGLESLSSADQMLAKFAAKVTELPGAPAQELVASHNLFDRRNVKVKTVKADFSATNALDTSTARQKFNISTILDWDVSDLELTTHESVLLDLEAEAFSSTMFDTNVFTVTFDVGSVLVDIATLGATYYVRGNYAARATTMISGILKSALAGKIHITVNLTLAHQTIPVDQYDSLSVAVSATLHMNGFVSSLREPLWHVNPYGFERCGNVGRLHADIGTPRTRTESDDWTEIGMLDSEGTRG